MTTINALEKLRGRNPHVWFDEGDLASVAPKRCRSLLYKALLSVYVAHTHIPKVFFDENKL